MTTYAYCRVSTKYQDLERQIRNIKEIYPDLSEKAFYCDKWTGTTTERPEWKKLRKRLKSGDTVIFDSVSRMSRQAKEGFELYKALYEQGISLVFLKEPYVNTENYRRAISISLPDLHDERLKPMIEGINKTLMFLAQDQFIGAFEQSEKEVLDIRQRIKEGMTPEVRAKMSQKAKERKGHTFQTKKSLDLKPKIQKMSKTFGGVFSDKEVIEILGMRPNTYYRYKRQIKEELLEVIEDSSPYQEEMSPKMS